jgi:hypothetical protein
MPPGDGARLLIVAKQTPRGPRTLSMPQRIGCYRPGTGLGGFESTVERTLSSVSAILMNNLAFRRPVERRRNPGKLGFRLIEFPCRDRRANLLLSRFERTDDARVASAAGYALARAFGCRFDVCHGINWNLRMRKSSKIRDCCKCQRRDLNPRPRAYESPALPLSYSGRSLNIKIDRTYIPLFLLLFYGLFHLILCQAKQSPLKSQKEKRERAKTTLRSLFRSEIPAIGKLSVAFGDARRSRFSYRLQRSTRSAKSSVSSCGFKSGSGCPAIQRCY